ncbi:MAG: RNA polymerase sigma factor [Bacteroidales bacterium]|nr:RNA polymerase sigma factor [Bacteroidales bacterium]
MTEQAFHNVWIPLKGRFYRIAYYILENEADAKDAVQELYLKLWNLRDHLEMVQNPSAYGTMLLRNLCIDRIRKARPSEPPDETVALEPPADDALETREELKHVREAIGRLPETQRKLLSLRVMEGLTYEEIAHKTGLSPLNIRVQVSLARKKLKQSL